MKVKILQSWYRIVLNSYATVGQVSDRVSRPPGVSSYVSRDRTP